MAGKQFFFKPIRIFPLVSTLTPHLTRFRVNRGLGSQLTVIEMF